MFCSKNEYFLHIKNVVFLVLISYVISRGLRKSGKCLENFFNNLWSRSIFSRSINEPSELISEAEKSTKIELLFL